MCALSHSPQRNVCDETITLGEYCAQHYNERTQREKNNKETQMIINIALVTVLGLLAAIAKSEADYANHQ